MQLLTTALLALAVTPLAAGAPAANKAVQDAQMKAIMAIAPTSSTCAGALAPYQCRTVEQAVGPIVNAFAKYNITTVGEMAAVLSIMAFESGDFKFNVNRVPGVPGQGTRNMQYPKLNIKYA